MRTAGGAWCLVDDPPPPPPGGHTILSASTSLSHRRRRRSRYSRTYNNANDNHWGPDVDDFHFFISFSIAIFQRRFFGFMPPTAHPNPKRISFRVSLRPYFPVGSRE